MSLSTKLVSESLIKQATVYQESCGSPASASEWHLRRQSIVSQQSTTAAASQTRLLQQQILIIDQRPSSNRTWITKPL